MNPLKLIPTSIKRKIRSIQNSGTAIVICYHGVHDVDLPFPIWTQIPQQLFEAHLKHIASHYDCITLGELERQLKNGRIEGCPVVITFDDGFANNYHIAYPLLQKYKLPATIYVSTDFTDTQNFIWADRISALMLSWPHAEVRVDGTSYPTSSVREQQSTLRTLLNLCKTKHPSAIDRVIDQIEAQLNELKPATIYNQYEGCFAHMTAQQLRELGNSDLITIGSHGQSHSILSRLSESEANAEITESKKKLESITRRDIRHFAFPNGTRDDFTDQHIKSLIQKGYVTISTTLPGRTPQNCATSKIPRMCIGNECSVQELDYVLSH